MAERRVELGRIVGAHGVRGWVRVASYTDPVDNLLSYDPLTLSLGDRCETLDVLSGRPQGKGLALRLDGIDDRDAALAWRGASLSVSRDRLPDAEPGTWYWADLVGLEVVGTDGTRYGRVERILETGANDVLVVRGDRERLVPFVAGQTIKDVDLDGGTITVDWDPAF